MRTCEVRILISGEFVYTRACQLYPTLPQHSIFSKLVEEDEARAFWLRSADGGSVGEHDIISIVIANYDTFIKLPFESTASAVCIAPFFQSLLQFVHK